MARNRRRASRLRTLHPSGAPLLGVVLLPEGLGFRHPEGHQVVELADRLRFTDVHQVLAPGGSVTWPVATNHIP